MTDWPIVLFLPLWCWLFVLPTGLALACGLAPHLFALMLRPFWAILNRVYLVAGILGATFLVAILVLIVIQMVARWTSVAVPGTTEFAGYAMAATSFFSLAYALTRGSHIRVSVFLNMNAWTRFWLDLLALWVAALIATYFARYAIKTNIFSRILNDRTQGQDMVPEWVLAPFAMVRSSPGDWAQIWAQAGSDWVFTPIWLPQLPMSVGTVLLAVALWDNLIRLAVLRETPIRPEAVA
jgi:TRAP-type C4-dicarboxylate transport system permease small subunit